MLTVTFPRSIFSTNEQWKETVVVWVKLMAILLYYPCVIGSMKTAHYRPENYHGICNCFLARPVARKPHPEPRPELPPNVRNPREWPQFPNCTSNCRWGVQALEMERFFFRKWIRNFGDEWWEVMDFSGCVTSIEGGGISGICVNLQSFHPGMPNSKELNLDHIWIDFILLH